MTVHLPSLPAMTRHFGAEYWQLQLTVSLYLVGNAILQLVLGPLSDRFGRRPVLLGAFALFTLATLGCIFAPTIELFLAFRMLQAAVVAGLALTRAIIRDTHDQDSSAAMIGWVMLGMSVAPLLGPTLGGVLNDMLGWKSVFWMLFLAGLAALWLIWSEFGETAQSRGRPMVAQLREYPELLRSPRFWGYSLCAGFASGCFFAFLSGAPYIGEHSYGLTPAGIGIALGVPALGYALGNYISGRYSVALGVNRMTLIGCLITTSGLALDLVLVAVGLGTVFTFFGCTALMAMGNGLTMPNTIAGTLSVRPSLAGSAAGLGGSLQIASGALLAAIGGQVLGDGTSPAPLLVVMLLSSIAAVLSILYVIVRTRTVTALA